MKKIISLCLVALTLIVFCSCGREEEDDGKALLTADSTINVTSNAGVITLNEDVVAIMLGVFSPEHLGLNDIIQSYDLKLGATKVFGKDACLVEAYAEGSDSPEGIFAILGQDCYVFKDNKYMLLTVNGPVEVTNVPTVNVSPNESAGDDVTTSTLPEEAGNENNSQVATTLPIQPQTNPTLQSGLRYDANNDFNLKKRFSSYPKETLGLEKDLNEYVLIAKGNIATDSDGAKLYVVFVYEKDGTELDIKFGMNDKNVYKFSETNNRFEKLN